MSRLWLFSVLFLSLLGLALTISCAGGDDDDDNDAAPGDDDTTDDDTGDDDTTDDDTGDDDTTDDDTGDDDIDKPNIYLYPEETTDISVTLVFGEESFLTWSWPAYNEGWNVSVDPDGMIDGLYPYLFYEARGPDIYQFDEGFIVPREGFFGWIEDYLFDVGFMGREVGDLLLYWTHELPEFAWYAVYPQFQDVIRHSIDLDVEPAPDSMLRLWFVILGYAEFPSGVNPAPPAVEPFEREGFTVTEWGFVTTFL